MDMYYLEVVQDPFYFLSFILADYKFFEASDVLLAKPREPLVLANRYMDFYKLTNKRTTRKNPRRIKHICVS